MSEEEEAEQCLWEWGRAAPFVLARMGGRKEDAESHGIYISFTWDSISKSFSMVLMITFFFLSLSWCLSLSSGLKKMSKEWKTHEILDVCSGFGFFSHVVS